MAVQQLPAQSVQSAPGPNRCVFWVPRITLPHCEEGGVVCDGLTLPIRSAPGKPSTWRFLTSRYRFRPVADSSRGKASPYP